MTRICKVYNLSKTFFDFEDIWRFQKYLQNQCWETKKSGKETWDSLILAQHNHVYTLGRVATLDNVKFGKEDLNLPLYRIERGGEVTYHGPGQLVAYPIFDLDQHKRDLHWFSRSLEQTVIDTLKRFNVTSERSDLNAGVWIRNSKISAQGINASRWITIHGASLNVSTDLSYYQKIVPCGLDRSIASVCSMNSLLHPSTFMITNVAEEWTKSFSTVFNVSIENVSNSMDIISSIPNKDKLERIFL